MESYLIPQIITAATAVAVAAVTVGGGYMIYKRRVSASTVSASRQAWIEMLRTEVCEFLLACEVFDLLCSDMAVAVYRADDMKQASDRMIRSRYHLQLLLNPTEEKHARLLKLLYALPTVPTPATEEAQRAGADWRAEVISCAQEILKQEWEVIKRGE